MPKGQEGKCLLLTAMEEAQLQDVGRNLTPKEWKHVPPHLSEPQSSHHGSTGPSKTLNRYWDVPQQLWGRDSQEWQTCSWLEDSAGLAGAVH